MSGIDLLLIGPGRQENLPLAYLAASARAAGHRPRLLVFDRPGDTAAVLAAVLAVAPPLIGVAIPFQHTVNDVLELIATLRREGFTGHLTTGGHVPTFCYAELLAAAPGLDSVVRHEGEVTLVELIDRLVRGEPLAGLPGLVVRDGAGLAVGPIRRPVLDLDTLPWPERPASPYHVGGLPMAFVLAARGCFANCAYCSIRAFAKDAGGPTFRMRSAADFAHELAALRRGQGIRVFFVQDDLFVLPSRRRTLTRLDELARELAARNVDDAIFWVKSRPESITPPVAARLAAIGTRHVFLGIENASAERLAYLGRTHRPEQNGEAIDILAAHGIRASFNIMLFDPETSLADVRANLAFGRQRADHPWNLCRTEVYPGTRLHARLAADGRLFGDFRSWGYVITDPRVETLFRVLRVALHERSLSHDSLLNRLVSLSFARQIHEALLPGAGTDRLSADVERLLRDVHEDTVEVIGRAVDFVETADLADHAAVRAFAVHLALEVNERSFPWFERFRRLWDALHHRGLARRAVALAPDHTMC